ncbi:hypothetical protein PproGo58_21910 [Pseudomonas protegens]|nr:hypothetical protein PproGo58_21910 [Pseudomonas protegens]
MQAGVEAEKIHGASCHAAQVPDKPPNHPALADEEACGSCCALKGAFAGKPAPTAGRNTSAPT